MMPETEYPFIGEGDRVDHRKFGFGTVIDVTGNQIEIDFDDHPGDVKRVMASFLTKIASAESRPLKFWDREWQRLQAAWLKARRDFEAAAAQFRPLPNTTALARLKAEEETAWATVQAFVEDERLDRHR